MSKFINNNRFFSISVIILVAWRAFLNGAIPLMDKTEARYAEIARIMAETNNYITPQIDYGIPFWAKPPLSTWLSAVSMDAFGVSEFTVRLPYLLLSILLIFLIGKYAKRENLPFFLPGFIALTIPQFYIHAGVVSTDTSLAFCIALVMLSFWETLHNPKNNLWKYLLFVGFGFGLLAKGPIIFILTLPPIFLWMLFTKSFKKVFTTIPFFTGTLLMCVIALPWYYLAEQKTPGFIDYFIVGEHFKRFLDSSWAGDKYGFPKQQPLGLIWVFLFVFALPWIQVVIGKIFKNRVTVFKNQWTLFLLLWLLFTPLFFTVSKSLIHPYILPVMIPIVLLTVHYWKNIQQKTLLIALSLLIPFVTVIGYGISKSGNKMELLANTDKYMIERICKKETPIYYLGEKSYSSQFYSKGKVKTLKTNDDLLQLTTQNTSFFLLLPTKKVSDLPDSFFMNFKFLTKNKKTSMYRFLVVP